MFFNVMLWGVRGLGFFLFLFLLNVMWWGFKLFNCFLVMLMLGLGGVLKFCYLVKFNVGEGV